MLNTKHAQLLRLLANGEFISGEELAQQLAVSRTTIATYVKALSERGLDIYSVKGKGYRLSQPLSLLDETSLITALPANQPQVLLEVDSTNAYLQQLSLAQHGQVILAEYQHAGRGRRGRQWQTPLAGQLCMSLLWRFHDVSQIAGLSLAVGIAVVEALDSLGFKGLGLKWPNDIYCEGRKLGGILIELQGQANDGFECIVGLGLNVQVPEQLAERIEQRYAQLSEQQSRVNRTKLAAAVITHLNDLYPEFCQQGIAGLTKRWQAWDCFAGSEITLSMAGDKRLEGRCLGIDEQGQLLVNVAGQTQSFSGGEVSLRKASS